MLWPCPGRGQWLMMGTRAESWPQWACKCKFTFLAIVIAIMGLLYFLGWLPYGWWKILNQVSCRQKWSTVSIRRPTFPPVFHQGGELMMTWSDSDLLRPGVVRVSAPDLSILNPASSRRKLNADQEKDNYYRYTQIIGSSAQQKAWPMF